MEDKNKTNDFNIDVELKDKQWQRKRRSRIARRFFKVVNVLMCGLTFLSIALFMIVMKRPTVSEIENRNLAKFPSFSFSDYFSGEYTSGIENYYNDTVPGRETLKNLVAAVRSHFGKKTEDNVKIHGTIVSKDDEKEEKAETKPAVTTAPAEDNAQGTTTGAVTSAAKKTTDILDNPNIEGEISNNILVYKNRGIMLYGGSFKKGQAYAETLNRFKSDLGKNVNVYSLVAPTPVSYYLPKKYEDMTGSEIDNIKNINEYLKNVTPVDAYGALKKHKDEKIYPRTDHHWTPLGAYYAAEEFAKSADVPFAGLSKYKKVTKEGYVGTLYGYSGDADLKNNPEDFVYYVPKDESYTTTYYDNDMTNKREGKLLINLDNVAPVSWYLVFMGSDDKIAHVHTKAGNGRKLAIVKDSYGNALVPYLTESFEDIYVIDMRYFELNAVSYFKEQGITDVLFAMNTFSATGQNSEYLEAIRTR